MKVVVTMSVLSLIQKQVVGKRIVRQETLYHGERYGIITDVIQSEADRTKSIVILWDDDEENTFDPETGQIITDLFVPCSTILYKDFTESEDYWFCEKDDSHDTW